MKNNLNVIQIKGFRGILYVGFIVICLAAGFGWFPSWVCMHAWNYAASYLNQIPTIGIFQGVLLWGIIAASYYTFRKEKLVVCMKASDGLSEEELRAVFADMKKQVQSDVFLRDMMKAHRAELKIRNLSESDIPGVSLNEVRNILNENAEKEQAQKIQSK